MGSAWAGSGGPNYRHSCGLSAPPVHHDAGWHTACVTGDSSSKTYAVFRGQELRWPWRSRRQPRQVGGGKGICQRWSHPGPKYTLK